MAPGSSSSLSVDRRKRGEREESRRNVLYLRYEAAYSPWNKDAQRSRTPEGRRKNVKTSGMLKLLRKFLPDLGFQKNGGRRENARKIPSKAAPRIRKNINISWTCSENVARNGDYRDVRELQFSGGIIEIAGESSREKKERGTQIDTRGHKKKERFAGRRNFPFEGRRGIVPRDKNCNNEGCAGWDLGEDPLPGGREIGIYGRRGSPGAKHTQRAPAGLGLAKYVATGRESVPNRRQSADRRPKFSNPGSTGFRANG